MSTLDVIIALALLLLLLAYVIGLIVNDRDEADREDRNLSLWAEQLNRGTEPLNGRHAAGGIADHWRPAHTAAGHADQGRHTAELPAVTA